MHELMTINLHTCLLHVAYQATACGPTALAAEWWLERLMQVFKRVVKYRCTRYPETTAVQHWLFEQALDDWKLQDPSVTTVLDGIRAGRSMADMHYDSVPGSCTLIGKLKSESLASKVRQEVFDGLQYVAKVNEKDHDGSAVTHLLDPNDVLAWGDDISGGRRKPLVHLSSSSTASRKDGASLLRTDKGWLSKQDFHALVPYLLSVPW
jgi:hypothetical protein